MKKMLSFLLCVLMCFGFAGCAFLNGAPINGGDFEETCQHTTNIGTCSKCGEFINHNDYASLKNKVSEAKNLANIALKSISSVPNGNNYVEKVNNAIESSQSQIDTARSKLKDAMAISSKYDELNDIYTALVEAKNALPDSITLTNATESEKYFDSWRDFVTEIASAEMQILYIK